MRRKTFEWDARTVRTATLSDPIGTLGTELSPRHRTKWIGRPTLGRRICLRCWFRRSCRCRRRRSSCACDVSWVTSAAAPPLRREPLKQEANPRKKILQHVLQYVHVHWYVIFVILLDDPALCTCTYSFRSTLVVLAIGLRKWKLPAGSVRANAQETQTPRKWRAPRRPK